MVNAILFAVLYRPGGDAWYEERAAANEQSLSAMEGMGIDIPPETLDMMDAMTDWGAGRWILIIFCLQLIAGGIFSTLGGLIGGSVFSRNNDAGDGPSADYVQPDRVMPPPPPPPLDAPPPPPPAPPGDSSGDDEPQR